MFPRAKIETPESIKGERFFSLQNGSLQISGAEKDDSGKYVCLASNTEGKSAITAVLDVKGIPAIWIDLTFFNRTSSNPCTLLLIKGPAHQMTNISMCLTKLEEGNNPPQQC